jgi:hypothetical protein
MNKCRFENSIGVARTGKRLLLLFAYQPLMEALAIYIGPVRRKPAVFKFNRTLWLKMYCTLP